MTRLEQYKAERRPSPFKVPEGYFALAAEKIMERVRESAPPQCAAPVMRFVRWLPYVAAACVVALALVLPRLFSAAQAGGAEVAGAGNDTAQQSYHEADYVYDYLTAADTPIPVDYDTYR